MAARATRALAVGVAVTLAAVLAAGAPLGADYDNPACRYARTCDDPAPAIDALAHGRVGAFFHQQPIAGPVSVVLRAPFVAVADATDGGLLDRYRIGAFACLLVLAAIALWLCAVARRRGAPLILQALVLIATLYNPLTSKVLFWGHPEDFIAAPLAVAGVLLATLGSPLAAGVALGVAVATKLWAGLALFVALAVAGRRWKRMLIAFAAVAAVLLGVMFLGDPSAFWHRATVSSHFGADAGTLTPAGAWYALSHQVSILAPEVVNGTVVFRPSVARVLDPWQAHAIRLLILIVAAGVVALWARRRPDPRRTDALAVLALVYLLRSTLEPGNYSYYLLPFLLALLAWEVVARRRLPVAAICAGACLWALGPLGAHTSAGGFNALYLVIAAVFTVYLCAVVFRARGVASSTLAPDGPGPPQHRETGLSAGAPRV